MIPAYIKIMPIIFPVFAGLAVLMLEKKRNEIMCAWTCFIATAINLLLCASMFGKEWDLIVPWGGMFDFNFSLRLYHFSSFILLASAGFGFLISLYSFSFMNGKEKINQFYSYFLITIGLVNGAVLADNLIVMLFFWEGLLLTLFGMIVIGNKTAFRTAIKAFIISGIADLCMMVGIALTIHLAGTMSMSEIHLQISSKTAAAAFLFLMIGAIAKAGSMPFHSWIPDAAIDAPLPFMALIPAALEKLLGIYFLARISLDLFKIGTNSLLSTIMMTVGCITILLAVMMALIQKDYKRLLSFHAISQVGYMILGIGTAVPAGIVGGIFHMINHAMYKSCLFLTGGSVEKQTGTTDLTKLGGIASKMPITFVCFIVAAASICGVPPFNGFFSKELVYDGALERGRLFYFAAVLGSFFTAASFLKLGHAAFLGKSPDDTAHIKEAPLPMLIPMITIAALCIFFGVWNYFPLRVFIQPILGEHRLEGHDFAGMPTNVMLIVVTLVVIIGSIMNHIWGAEKSGSGLGAADHIHDAPLLHTIYDKAEQRMFDPYEIGMKFASWLAKVTMSIDKVIDYIYNVVVVEFTYAFTGFIRRLHSGSYALYVVWSLLGTLIVVLYIMRKI
ncbi:MAG: NADH-quinone oxidoreductase subunit L [Kiritimatiellae bacterium]|nr:NADH-quinone oxidoreductase subunit L [Kiritimatiellia bacterium]MDD5520697.1 NADH-quinone oxidoreductase subunit L [Kiritimatiellia bacterium]